MKRRIAEYRVKADKLDIADAAIRQFVAAIAREEPATHYTAYRRGEKADYIHFMSFPDEEAETFHREAPHTREFVDVLYPNCEIMPEFTDLTPIASAGGDGRTG